MQVFEVVFSGPFENDGIEHGIISGWRVIKVVERSGKNPKIFPLENLNISFFIFFQ